MTIDIEAIKKRALKASPGPWVVPNPDIKYHTSDSELESEVHQAALLDSANGCVIGCAYNYSATTGGIMTRNHDNDAAFIAAAREDVPALIAALKESKRDLEALARLVLALRDYDTSKANASAYLVVAATAIVKAADKARKQEGA